MLRGRERRHGRDGPASMRHYWDRWVSPFKPSVVVIYPTPGFYLGDRPPRPYGPAPPAPKPVPAFANFSWRVLDRARDAFDHPDVVQRWRDERAIAAAQAQHPAGWLFTDVPRDRVDAYRRDLEAVVTAVAGTGARPILLTHAVGFAWPPRPEQEDALLSFHRLSPRAPGPVLMGFERAAAYATRDLARSRGVVLVDAAQAIGGRAEWFGPDLIHFNDAGAAEMARLLSVAITAPQQAE